MTSDLEGEQVLAAEVPARSRRRRHIGGVDLLVKILPVIGLFLLWEVVVRVFSIPTYQLPAVSALFSKLWSWTQSGDLFLHSGSTIFRSLAGIVAASAVGIAMGLVMAWYRPMERLLDYLVAGSYAVPKVATIPLFIVWLGVGETPKLAISFVGALYPILLNTIVGVKGVEPILIKAARDLGATDRQLFWEVILPGALPTILVGLKIGAGTSFVVVVATEMMLANSGLGYLIATSASILALDGVFSGLVVLAFIGVIIFSMVDALERLMVPWHVELRHAARASGAAARATRGSL